jgi:hypothetical protein
MIITPGPVSVKNPAADDPGFVEILGNIVENKT